tara:strand:- start:265 stop:444 length:180 start_codon:yes stop_codon:yes gene_type:complete
MASTLDSQYLYSEIITHAALGLMTKLTDYPSPAKQEAKIEAQRRNAEARVLYQNTITSN